MKTDRALHLLKALLASAAVFFVPVNAAHALPGFGNGAPCNVCHGSANPSAADLLPCPAGQSRDPVTHLCTAPVPVACTGDTISPNGLSPCTPCPAGQTANATHTACSAPATACMGNTIGPAGQAPCTPCPSGQIADATHTSCACPAGQTLTNGVCQTPGTGMEHEDHHEGRHHFGDHHFGGHDD